MEGVVILDKIGGNILLTTPWQQGIAEACKRVNGAQWIKSKNCWAYPLSWQVCLEIRRYVVNPFELRLKLTDEMMAWATAEKARQESIPDPNVGTVIADLPGVAARNPLMHKALLSRPFQTVGVDWGVKTKEFILADDPGLGKTIQTLAVLEEANLRGPILVVANTSAQQVTWPHQILEWGREKDEYLIFESKIHPTLREETIREVFRDCEADPELRVFVLMNPYWVRMQASLDKKGNYLRSTTGVVMKKAELPIIFKHEWAAIIADESHETLAVNSNMPKKWSQQRQGMGALKVRDGGFKISISGTPMRGKPENMFGQLQWLAPGIYTSFWRWAERHFEMEQDDWTGNNKVSKLRSEEEFYNECSRYMIRRSKSQVAKDLPPKMYGGERFDPKDPESLIGVWLDMGPEQKKAYDQLLKEGAVIDGDEEKSVIGILAEYTRMKQLATSCATVSSETVMRLDEYGSPEVDDGGFIIYDKVTTVTPKLPSNKFDWLLNFLEERDLIGPNAKGMSKVIISSQFTKVVNLFRNELKNKYETDSFMITGAVNAGRRREYQEQFQSDPNSPKIFFLQTKAGGTSLTLDAADDVVILDEMWNPDNQEQVEDRAHRLSRIDHHVTIWYLRTRNSIEEYIGTTLEERLNTCKGVMDGQRGVEYRKRLLKK